MARSAKYSGVLRLLTVNDVYSPSPVEGCGGWSQLSTILDEHRTANSIVCINGDFLGGSALAEHFEGKNVIEIMNALRTDLVVLGNHEFDYGPDILKKRMKESNFTWLGSNILEKKAGAGVSDGATAATTDQLMEHVQNLHQVTIQLERVSTSDTDNTATANNSHSFTTNNHHREFPATTQASIGVFGLCTPRTPELSWPGPNISFTPVAPVAENCLAKLKGHLPFAQGEMTSTALPRPIPFSASPVLTSPSPSPLPVSKLANGTAPSASSASVSSLAAPSVSGSLSPCPPTYHPPPAVDPSNFTPCDGILAITHLSNFEDKKLARAYDQAISLIIGGHDHDPVASLESNTLIFKAGQNAWWLGIIDLKLEVVLTEKNLLEDTAAATHGDMLAPPASSATSATGAPIPTASPSPPSHVPEFHRTFALYPSWRMECVQGYKLHDELQQLIDGYVAAMERAQSDEDPNEVICQIGSPALLPDGTEPNLSPEDRAGILVTKTSVVRRSASSFAQMTADAMCLHYAESGADGAIINGGFIRGDKAYAEDYNLTLRDVRYELPFPKVCVLIRIKGKGILQALNQMLQAHPHASGSFPHVSGAFDVEFDPSNPLSPNKVTRLLHNGSPLDLEKDYKIAVTTFMATGGDGITGFSTFGTIISKDSFKVADLVLRYLRGQKVYHPVVMKRVREVIPAANQSGDGQQQQSSAEPPAQ